MLKIRVIPSLLLQNGGLVKTIKFSNPKYVGDPINAIKIFNDKEVDELVILDIKASQSSFGINFELLNRINKEAFMPLGYGGGIKSAEEAKRIFNIGYEKVILDSAALSHPQLITDIASLSGSQSVVVCVDVKRTIFGKYRVFNWIKRKIENIDVVDYARKIEGLGAGELLIYSVDQDGTMQGYDYDILKAVTNTIKIPVVALGGAGSIDHFFKAIKMCNVSAVAAGSFFVFHGPHRAVLISYPDKSVLKTGFSDIDINR
jgi:cyclase